MTGQSVDRDLGQLSTVDGKSVLRFARRYRHPQPKVWRAITEPEHLAQWFPAEVELELRAGAPIRFRYPGVDVPAPGGMVREVDPPHVFEFSWDRDVLRWELLPDGDGCLLRFTTTFDDHAGAASFATGWSGCLDALASVLAAAPVSQPAGDRTVAQHESYVAAFGLAAGQVRESVDGWDVRFERQLMMAPVAVAWAALTASQPVEVGDGPPLPATTHEVAAGAVTARQAPTEGRMYEGGIPTAGEPVAILEYEWLSAGDVAGNVRWELYPGPGGARIVLIQRVPAALADQRATALAAWHVHLESLAGRLRGVDGPTASVDRVAELRRNYAASLT